ncbi:sensor histidine kinase [Phenylobacterium zucineum]|uniref:sensor histidine kinase n=1 Tax=Phenylobacterium zucineum TaxID=284016 RepID=UPI000A03C505|nr:ATP-binding protein [Phenylobacterium zucineum]
MRPDPDLSGGSASTAAWRQAIALGWMIAVLALLGVASMLTASREPDYSLAVQTVECRRVVPDAFEGQAKIFHLPFATRSNPGDRSHLECDFELRLTKDEARDAALLIPSFADAVAIQVNGRRIAMAELYMMRDLRFATLPAYVPNLAEVLEPGANQFKIMVSARPGRPIALDRIFIGPRDKLRPFYHARWFAAAVAPTVAVGAEIALACMFGLIWVARPRETEFGWLAAAMMLAALRGSVLIPDFGLGALERPFWNVLVGWEAAATLMFCRVLSGQRPGRWSWLLAVPPLAFTAIFVAWPPPEVVFWVLRAAVATVALYFTASTLILLRAAFRGDRDALLVSLGLVMVLVFLARDVMMVATADPSRVFLMRVAYTGFLATVATLMTLRFIRAMRKVDETADVLRERVAEVEAQLRETFEELRARREAEAVERERARLMRDLHDGLGGELASILALADSPDPSHREIAGHARAALTDMRLIIGSLEDYGGDLSLVLGAWRERAEPQLRASGLTLEWRVGDVPALETLGPAQALDVLRIVQEAVTNVVKHARATRVRVEVFADEDGVVVAVRDDGQELADAPFEAEGAGRGLGNMKARAERLGASLTVGRSDGETSVVLRLPAAPVGQGVGQGAGQGTEREAVS